MPSTPLTSKGFMNLDFLAELNVDYEQNAELSHFTTFRIGGRCPCLVDCKTPAQLEAVIQALIQRKVPYILIGGGSNIVVSDEGLKHVVVRFFSGSPYIQHERNELHCSAATNLDDLVLFAAEAGLEGLNTCSGIPGTVGGAIVGNAGAFGKAVGDVLKNATLITPKGEVKEVGCDYCKFSYRSSALKKTGDIVLDARFSLKPGDTDALLDERHDILSQRYEKHPDLSSDPCAGSFYRNIEPTSKAGQRQAAGWFLDQAGGKALRSGGAAIFPKHANIIINSNNATAADVLDLSKQMFELVKSKYRIKMEREVRFIGKINGEGKDGYW